MANAATPLIPADGTITFTDGAALSFVLLYESGDLQVSGLKKGQLSNVVFKDRGVPYSVRATEIDEAIEFSFSCDAICIVGDNTTATIGDVLLRAKVWSAATSTLPVAKGDAYCVTLSWVGERTNLGASTDSGLVLKYCELSADFSEAIPGKFSVKGRAFCISTDYITASG